MNADHIEIPIMYIVEGDQNQSRGEDSQNYWHRPPLEMVLELNSCKMR